MAVVACTSSHQRLCHDDKSEKDAPLADNDKVVFDALVVDVRVLLEERHRDLGIANPAFSDSGHALGRMVRGAPCL